MATDFLNDARREIEGRTEDFYGELKAFYQGSGEAEQNLMNQTTQPFWQSLCLSKKRLQQRELTVDMDMQEKQPIADYDGPKRDGYDYAYRRTMPVKMKRIYYHKGKKIAQIAILAVLAICAGGIMFLLLAMGRNGYNAVKAAAVMMLGIGLAPVFFHSLFYMLLIFIVMMIVMEACRKPRI